MKKIFAILMAICMMLSVLSVPAFAEEAPADEPAAGTVLRISAINSDGDTVVVADHTIFEDGWNAAMKLANDMEDYDYTRVIVDIYADWIANNGNFTDDAPWETNGPGFSSDNIYFNDDVRMTLNMNGHTIDADCTPRRNGEVMYIDTDADVIINNGTITGGGSFNGAGGIHINSGAKVTLNNVNVIGNVSWDDDGGGIALYDGASLVMNGGSLKDNQIWHDTLVCYGGAIYAKESSVILNNVEIKNNVTKEGNDLGAAIYADESTVELNGCTVDGNGKKNDEKNYYAATSIIHALESSITVKNTSFTNNGDLHYVNRGRGLYTGVSTLIYLDDSSLVMDGGGISGNTLGYLIQVNDNSEFYVSGTNMTRNNAIVLKSNSHAIGSYFNGCTFGNNNGAVSLNENDKDAYLKYSFLKHAFAVNTPVTFYNCYMGNSTYSNPANIKFINENLDSGVVLTISGRKVDGTVVKIEEHRSFEEGWAAAMRLAIDSYWMNIENNYEAVVVDMHTDWIASNGRFTNALINGIGFNSDTIHVSEGACLILNMNGRKIDRGLTTNEANGEVMYIASGADIIINDGTITGGYSHNGAGGIHITSDAKVTLNNVNVVGNKVEDDDGAGIAVYGGTLVMNGGSVSNNVVESIASIAGDLHGGGINAEDSTVVLNDVTLENNNYKMEHLLQAIGSVWFDGAAIAAEDSTVRMKNCSVKNNGIVDEGKKVYCQSIIYVDDSTLVIEGTSFIGNGTKGARKLSNDQGNLYRGTSVINAWDSSFDMSGGKFTDNNSVFLMLLGDTVTNVEGVDFTGNNGLSLNAYLYSAEPSTFTNCKFSKGTEYEVNEDLKFEHDFIFNDSKASVKFVDCDFGDATFSDKNAVTFVGGTVSNGVGSLFGEGSMTMIISILALISSGVCIFLTVYYNKKKEAPVAANGAAETNDGE